MICVVAIVIYNVFNTNYGDKDVPEARKVVAQYVEFKDRIYESGKCSQKEADTMSQLWFSSHEGMEDIESSVSISKKIIDEQGSYSHKTQIVGCEGINEKTAYVYIAIKRQTNTNESNKGYRYTMEKTNSGWKIKSEERWSGNFKRFT